MAQTIGALEIQMFANIARLQQDMNKATKTVDVAMNNISKAVTATQRLVGGISFAFAGAGLIKLADEYKRFDSQIKLATRSQAEYLAMSKDVQAIALKSQSSISAVGTLYSRLANYTRDAGVPLATVGKVTEAVSLQLRVMNSTVNESASVMIQLSQALGKGKLDGQEFTAVAEAAPPLMIQLAKSMGVPVGALQKLREEGKLTRDEMIKAWTDPTFLATLNENVKAVGTVSSSLQVAKDKFMLFIGEMDKSKGVTATIAKGILGLADSLNGLMLVIGAIGAVGIGKIFGGMANNFRDLKTQVSETAVAQQRQLVLNEQLIASEKVKAQNEIGMAQLRAQAKVRLLELSVAEKTASMANVEGSTRETNAMRVLEAETYKLIQAKGALAKVNGAVGLSMDNNASATTKLVHQWQEAEAINGKLANGVTQTSSAVGALTKVGSGLLAFLGGWSGIMFTGVIVALSSVYMWLKKINEEKEITKFGSTLEDIKNAPEWAKAGVLLSHGKKIDNKTAMEEVGVEKNQKSVVGFYRELVKAQGDLATMQKRLKETGDPLGLIQNQIKAQKELVALRQQDYAKSIVATKLAQKSLDDIKTVGDLAKNSKALDATKALKGTKDDGSKSALKAIEAERKAGLQSIQEQIKEETLLTSQKNKQAKEQKDAELKELHDLSVAKAKDANEHQEMLRKLHDRRMKDEKDAFERKMRDEAEIAQREYERISDNISRSLTDALMRGFESGKSIAENFKQVLKNMFATLVLQPAIKMVLDGSGVTGIMSQIARSVGGSSGGLINNIVDGGASGNGSLGANLVNILTTSNQSIINGIAGFGDTLSDLFGASSQVGVGALQGASVSGGLGGFISSNASGIASGLSYAKALYDLTKGNVAQGVLAGVGTYFGGPIGGMIGSAIGGLFGGKKAPRFSSQSITQYNGGNYQTTAGNPMYKSLGATNQTTGLNEAYFNTLSPLFKSFDIESELGSAKTLLLQKRKKSYGIFEAIINGQTIGVSNTGSAKSTSSTFDALINNVLTVGITKAINVSSLAEGIKMLFDGLLDKDEIGLMVQASLNLSKAQKALGEVYGINADQAGKISVASGLAGKDLATFANSLAEVGLATRKTSLGILEMRDELTDAIGQAVPSSLKAYDNLLKGINKTTDEGIAQFTELFKLRSQYAQFQGALDTITGNVNSAIFGMLSPAEQLASQRNTLADMFKELNVTMPQSVKQLIDLGKSIDYGTEAGLDMALAFPAIVELFNEINSSATAMAQSLNAGLFTTFADYRSAQANVNAGNSPLAFIKGQSQTNSELLNEIKAMKQDSADNKAILTALIEYTRQQQRIIDDWDVYGMPAERVV